MGQKKELIKRINKQYAMAMKELEKALEQAKPMVQNIGWGKSPLAAVQLAELIFQINMGKEQQIAKVDKILAMQRIQDEMMKKQKETQGGKSPCGCGSCSACRGQPPK